MVSELHINPIREDLWLVALVIRHMGISHLIKLAVFTEYDSLNMGMTLVQEKLLRSTPLTSIDYDHFQGFLFVFFNLFHNFHNVLKGCAEMPTKWFSPHLGSALIQFMYLSYKMCLKMKNWSLKESLGKPDSFGGRWVGGLAHCRLYHL